MNRSTWFIREQKAASSVRKKNTSCGLSQGQKHTNQPQNRTSMSDASMHHHHRSDSRSTSSSPLLLLSPPAPPTAPVSLLVAYTTQGPQGVQKNTVSISRNSDQTPHKQTHTDKQTSEPQKTHTQIPGHLHPPQTLPDRRYLVYHSWKASSVFPLLQQSMTCSSSVPHLFPDSPPTLSVPRRLTLCSTTPQLQQLSPAAALRATPPSQQPEKPQKRRAEECRSAFGGLFGVRGWVITLIYSGSELS